MTTLKDDILRALHGFARQRPGMEPGNYGDWNAYRREAAEVTRDLADFNRIASAVGWSSITGEALLALGQDGGRLELSQRETDGAIRVQYITGQYFPTEYRKAACRLLARALWYHWRDDHANGESLRKAFRREFGRRIASRYFD